MVRRDMRSRAKTNSEMQDRTTTDVIGKALAGTNIIRSAPATLPIRRSPAS